MADKCDGCRAYEPTLRGTYGSTIEYKCSLYRSRPPCKKKIRTIPELISAQETSWKVRNNKKEDDHE